MTVGTASGIQAAIDGTSAVEDVAYVCRHRYYSSRRACFWTPGGYYRPYRRYRRW
jgi:phage terminase large subunit-like protein